MGDQAKIFQDKNLSPDRKGMVFSIEDRNGKNGFNNDNSDINSTNNNQYNENNNNNNNNNNKINNIGENDSFNQNNNPTVQNNSSNFNLSNPDHLQEIVQQLIQSYKGVSKKLDKRKRIPTSVHVQQRKEIEKNNNTGNNNSNGAPMRKQENCLKRLVSEKDLQQILKYNSKKIIWRDASPFTSNNFQDDDAPYQIKKSKILTKLINPVNFKAYNHLSQNYNLYNKKSLFYNMRDYYHNAKQNVFDYLPLTFHIQNGLEDPQFGEFLIYFEQYKQLKKSKNIWILKPGENSNRGHGITVAKSLDEIKLVLQQASNKNADDHGKTLILQKYIENPLLYNKRKFDLRCYILITKYNSGIKGYWYNDGYVRTSSSEFSFSNLSNIYTHLTNDCVQKKGTEYGKFEEGNKITFQELQKYLEIQYGSHVFNLSLIHI
eukprot:TRINITY_DN12344_c0_g1_i2.p1 TRINITY_DN12344_c0_g1~~TRINITY_DN12344_c0_g1_i2.p1  ORF type:complete len:432 (-),score=62.32 TRINITY_DN12344_c0_g1_i2:165-1460(-)